MDELRAEKFDVGMAEAFCFTEYSLALFHFLQIAVTIATQSQPMSPFQLYLMGHLSKMKQSEGMPTARKPVTRIDVKWDNVITQSWINQKELLAHPKTKAFVSHCGMNSLSFGERFPRSANRLRAVHHGPILQRGIDGI
ncbi:hypothetical protein niasHT_024744 [Heterodera trifolii]|uniref:glucuronosyltransferase n=1 Tax=Heterodera trifolii TaxID=157864 RepID=A0ABD2JHA3_9BILA